MVPHPVSSPEILTPRTKGIHIDRPVVNQLDLFPKYDIIAGFDTPKPCYASYLKKIKCNPLELIVSLVPIIGWLPRYKWKEDLLSDCVAGLTIAVFHIPHGLANAFLANLPPIAGIYMAYTPVAVYSFLGTSRQLSMGSMAVICLMTGKTALYRLKNEIETNISSPSASFVGDSFQDIDALLQDEAIKTRMIEISTAIAFAVGFWQILMGILRMGSLSLLLSTELVSGFTTGAAFHLASSQLRNVLGLKLPRREGVFKIFWISYDVLTNIRETNLLSVGIWAIGTGTLLCYNDILKPKIFAKVPIQLPVELFVITLGTLISYYFNLEETHNVSVVKTIPTGLPAAGLPPFEVVTSVLFDSLIIGIVSYALCISMCKILASKHNYAIDPNQELIAQGSSSLVGSFFSSAPPCAALSRTAIQDAAGGRTQLVGLFCVAILTFVLLWIGPFFEPLPNCILAVIILVAVRGLLMQVFDVAQLWKASKVNALTWLVTFLVTVVVDIEYGLAAGFIFSVFVLVWGSTRGNVIVLGSCSNFELYGDIQSNHQAKEVRGIKILKYTGCLNFVNGENFIKKVDNIMHKNQQCCESVPSATAQSQRIRINSIISEHSIHQRAELKNDSNRVTYESPVGISSVIFDFSSLCSIDLAAVRLLTSLHNYFQKVDIQVLYAGSPSTVLQTMDTSSFVKETGATHFFPSVHDAVTFVLNLKRNSLY